MEEPAAKKTRSERATQEQLQCYVHFCREHPQLQTGKNNPNSPQLVGNLWGEVAAQLNALRGPSRTAAKWKERARKKRKLYFEDVPIGDEDVEGTRGFSVAEKLESIKFALSGIVKELNGADLNVCYIQRFGMSLPLLIREKTGLGLEMPNPDEFDVNDVRLCVGSRRLVDVMDVNTQKNLQMTMKEWQQYYENPRKKRLLNVISLEFSHTRLDQYVQSPFIVRQIDWTDTVWPRQLKNAQRDPTNAIGEMMYPKVQKYCLMSVRNCYTDFHIDFGGSSVWYHILKGSKVFWLIPPTDRNLQLYERWVLSGKQSDVFFGDTVDKCARVYLTAGNTFFIPSGWIHAVYTPEDSLVFGGNFLHSFGIKKQLKTVHVEDCTRVPQKFRYPFFTEMLWYVLARYVYILLGNAHLYGELSGNNNTYSTKTHIHLTHYELFGLKEIVMYLYDLPPQKKNVPELVRDPVMLIKDVRILVERHCHDKMEMACTGISVLMPHNLVIKCQPYDRSKVEYEIKLKISLKNSEIMQKQKRFRASNPPKNIGNTSLHSAMSSVSNCAVKGQVKQINNKRQAEINPQQNVFLRNQQSHNMMSESATATPSNFRDGRTFVASATGIEYPSSIRKPTLGSVKSSLYDFCDSPPVISKISSNNSVRKTAIFDGITTANSFATPRRRRTRCKSCSACKRIDCGECTFCLDMVKFGGPGRAKQTCMLRQCLAPMLPLTAQCVYCQLDGWWQVPIVPPSKIIITPNEPSALMECSVCYEIAHPDCSLQPVECTEVKSITNEDLPNSWECPHCCQLGKNSDYKPRHFRARHKSCEVRRSRTSSGENFQDFPTTSLYNNVFTYTSESDVETCNTASNFLEINGEFRKRFVSDMALSKLNELSRKQTQTDKRNSINIQNVDVLAATDIMNIDYQCSVASESQSNYHLAANNVEAGGKHKQKSIRCQLAQQMLKSSSRFLKKPQHIVRTSANHLGHYKNLNSLSNKTNLATEPYLLKLVFKHLAPETLVTCCSVCKAWSNVAVDPMLWKNMNVSEHKMTANLLTAIVRRQPEHLIINWTQIAKRQLTWLITRLPVLKSLYMQNCSIQAVTALHTCFCPPLHFLDLSFVHGLNDAVIRDILAPPKDSRPGLIVCKTRLRELQTFKVSGTDVTDVAVRYIIQTLANLEVLDLSSCQRITDAGIAQISTSITARMSLVNLNLSACRLVTEHSLEHLLKCEELLCLDLRYVPQVSTQAVIKFAARSKHDLCVKDVKLVAKRRTSSPGKSMDHKNIYVAGANNSQIERNIEK